VITLDKALTQAARDSFLKNQKRPMKNIYRRFGQSKSKNDCIEEDAVGGLFGEKCGNSGMETGLEMCDSMVEFYNKARVCTMNELFWTINPKGPF